MDELAQRVQIALQKFKRNFESDSAKQLDCEITKPQMFLLYAIQYHGINRLKELAEKMEVKPSAITVMIDRLEKAGFIQRSHDHKDRRSTLVSLTPSGVENLEKVIQERNHLLKTYLLRLGPDEREKFAELLEKMIVSENK